MKKVIVNVTTNFKSEAKPLLKKYPSLVKELLNLEAELSVNPQKGTSLGNNAYKIRLRIRSKGKGKSGGARIITYLETTFIRVIDETTEQTTVNLLSIYDKSEVASITDKELKELIKACKAIE